LLRGKGNSAIIGHTQRALPSIADAVSDRLTVLADSGVRSGIDGFKMLASGAREALLGRASGGQQAVERLIGLNAAEMQTAITLAGVRSIDAINRNLINLP
jgi:L-lactate dehydrogenase (cytochrome)